MMILSSAWLITYASCSGNSRMLSVCSTAPMHGIAKYASRCSCVFQQNVPTRSPSPMPSFVERGREPVGVVGDLGEGRAPCARCRSR